MDIHIWKLTDSDSDLIITSVLRDYWDQSAGQPCTCPLTSITGISVCWTNPQCLLAFLLQKFIMVSIHSFPSALYVFVIFHIHATGLTTMQWAIAISTCWLPSLLKNTWSYHSQVEGWGCEIMSPHQDPFGPEQRPAVDDQSLYYPSQGYYYAADPCGPFHALTSPGYPWLQG